MKPDYVKPVVNAFSAAREVVDDWLEEQSKFDIFININEEWKKMKADLDSGATVSVGNARTHFHDYEIISGDSYHHEMVEIVVHAAGTTIPIIGYTIIDLKINLKEEDSSLVVKNFHFSS